MTQAQLEMLLSFEPPADKSDESKAAIRGALAVADGIAECLNKVQDPGNHDNRQDLHCLQRTVLDFYTRVGPPSLYYEDLLARGALSFHHCLFPDSEGANDWRTCEEDIQTALVGYQRVFSAAHQISEDNTTYSSSRLAEDLGIDIFEPAPDFEKLQELVDLGITAARQHPELAQQVGAVLGSSLCNSLDLYGDRRRTIENTYNTLIRLDGGDLTASGPAFRFLGRLRQYLGLQTLEWEAEGGPCAPQQGPLETLRWERGPDSTFSARGGVLKDLRRIEHELYGERTAARPAKVGTDGNGDSSDSGMEPLEDLERVSAKWRRWFATVKTRESAATFVRAYAELLFDTGRTLGGPGAGRHRGDWRHDLTVAGCDALASGLAALQERSTASQIRLMRNALLAQIMGYGGELFRDLRFRESAELASRYLSGDGKILAEAQRKQLHTLAARSWYLAGEDSLALIHVRESDTTVSELKTLKEGFKSWGVGVKRRRRN